MKDERNEWLKDEEWKNEGWNEWRTEGRRIEGQRIEGWRIERRRMKGWEDGYQWMVHMLLYCAVYRANSINICLR